MHRTLTLLGLGGMLALATSLAVAENLPPPDEATTTPDTQAIESASIGATSELASVQQRWAEIKYQLPESERASAFESLVAQIEKLRARSDSPALRIWEGIVLASQAGAQGGLGALSLVKRARADFEAAIAEEPNALNGSAYVSLGSLYYQVPGWPLGFGNDEKALEMLQKGLSIDPDGIDANFFYGDFLLDQHDWTGAISALEKAAAAPDRPGRASADAGRRAEIEAALEEARSHL